MSLVIRKATLNDVTVFADYRIQSLLFHYAIHPNYEPADNAREIYEEMLTKAIQEDSPDVLNAVVEKDNSVIGILIAEIHHQPLRKRGKYGFIDVVFIDEKHRGESIGDQVLDYAWEWFKTEGIRDVELECICGNKAGEDFWLKRGFYHFEQKLIKEVYRDW